MTITQLSIIFHNLNEIAAQAQLDPEQRRRVEEAARRLAEEK